MGESQKIDVALVAVPGPFTEPLAYLYASQAPKLGTRVLVPLGKRRCIGVVMGFGHYGALPEFELKTLIRVVDELPLFNVEQIKWLQWLANYYHCPMGRVIKAALIKALDKPVTLVPQERYWQLTDLATNIDLGIFSRAPKQLEAIKHLSTCRLSQQKLQARAVSSVTLRTLKDKNYAIETQCPSIEKIPTLSVTQIRHSLALNDEQKLAIEAFPLDKGFTVGLLEGVTSSGKTRVYIELMASVLLSGQQVLMMVPEIGLTPQTVLRLSDALPVPVLSMHSNMTDKQKHALWAQVHCGGPLVVLGTRSALFCPFDDLGLIVIDEEHDGSYRQHTGLNYSAKDAAMMRAKGLNIPILLGSATPTLESLHNALTGKYRHLRLQKRATLQSMPNYHLIDMRAQFSDSHLSQGLEDAIERHIAKGEQVLLFINRKGYSSALFCPACQECIECKSCDSNLTYHLRPLRLVCHHCGLHAKVPSQCPKCGSTEQLKPVGAGTEKIEDYLQQRFSDVPVLRFDRESTRLKGALHQKLEAVQTGDPMILVGTQMIAKGHHFKRLGMVGIINADQSLMSFDFRALEQLGQLITQVSGRAGREAMQGEVYLQTHQPEHRLLKLLLTKGYHDFAQALLQERAQAQLPPYAHLVSIQAQARQADKALSALSSLKNQFLSWKNEAGVELIGPAPCLMSKKANWHRAQLLLQANDRGPLHALLKAMRRVMSDEKKVKWVLEVDALTID